ncbi:MAG: 2-oxoacid:ferredoxin oxidoreductase subunit gamma, partial [Proteobacteria bacterium]|nr:2-oxoacid:ferredoxin oxidoreductase subunit gamma [Pseudomonadota bacterium]
EMRGGTANCTLVISTEEIGSPIIGKPLSAIIMNNPSLMKFENHIKP